jgi:nucleotide-binding universal stress UspA family protein
MMQNVLIPLDGSPLAEQAADYAPKLLATGSSITLLSVVRIPSAYFATEMPLPVVYTASDVTRLLQDELQAARDYLETVARGLREKGFKVYIVAETGDAPTVIADQARSQDVVMMTTHGRTGLNRLLYGSVTQQVIGLSTRPVMVIPSRAEEEVKASEAEEGKAPNKRLNYP